MAKRISGCLFETEAKQISAGNSSGRARRASGQHGRLLPTVRPSVLEFELSFFPPTPPLFFSERGEGGTDDNGGGGMSTTGYSLDMSIYDWDFSTGNWCQWVSVY